MKSKHIFALFAALFAVHCGNAVRPTGDAAHEAASDAAATTTTVTFVATTAVSINPSPVADARVRAETADGLVVEGTTDTQGRVELALVAGLRWDVTFAHRQTQVVSILGLRPEAVQREVSVWMKTLSERFPRGPTGFPVYADAPIQRVRLALQPRIVGTSASAGPAVVRDEPVTFPGPTADLLYQRTDDRGIDVVVMESEEDTIRETYSRPLRLIHRRIEPTPQGDIDLALDINDARPVEPAVVINVMLPSEGLITAATTRPFYRSTGGAFLATGPWSEVGSYKIGTLLQLPPTEQSPWRLRMILGSRALVPTDELGQRVRAQFSFGTGDVRNQCCSVIVRPDVLNPRDIAVPVLHRLSIVGTSLTDLRIEARGAYEQFGFEVYNRAMTARGADLQHWVGWNFDPMDAEQLHTIRLPHLPGGMTLGEWQGIADGPFFVSAIVSTLPRTRPAYGFWRSSHETINVATQSSDLPR